MRKVTKQFMSFLCVGSACLALNLAALYCLTDIIGLHYLLSCCIAIIMVNYAGFQANKVMTFRDHKPEVSQKNLWQFFKYNIVSAISFVLVITQMYVLVDIMGMWYIHANIIIGIIMAFANFVMHRSFTYTARPRSHDS